MPRSTVAVLRVSPEHILADIERLCELGELGRALERGTPTVLTNDVSSHLPFPSANTTPWQLEGAVLALRNAGFDDVSCLQTDSEGANAYEAEAQNHYARVFRRHGIPVLYSFRQGDVKWVEYRPKSRLHVLHRVFRDGLHIPDYLQGKNIVHLPTVKCRADTTAAGAMNNAFASLLSTERDRAGSWIQRALVDLLAIEREIHPGAFAIADGTTAGDGADPHTPTPVVKNVMLASADSVAIDAVAAKLMGFDPLSIEHIRVAHDDGLGIGDPADIRLLGDDHIGEERWGFRNGKHGGPFARARELLLHTPAARALRKSGAVVRDRYRWPRHQRAVFEQWQRDTPWGQLFRAYGDASRGPSSARPSRRTPER